MTTENTFELKDSGQRQQFSTGAQRDTQEDKPRFDLIPPKGLERVAFVYARGAEKYDENNWMKGIPLSRTLASAERHLQSFKQGDKSEDHLAQAVWNLLAILHYEAYPQFYEHLYDLPDFTADTLEEALKICTECGRRTPEHDEGCPYGGWEGDPDDDPVALEGSGPDRRVSREEWREFMTGKQREEDRHQGLSDPMG